MRDGRLNWLTPLRFKRSKRIVVNLPRYRAKANSGRRGTPIDYRGLAYPSLAACARANGITKATIRWRLGMK